MNDCVFLQFHHDKSELLEIARPLHDYYARAFHVIYVTSRRVLSRLPVQWHKIIALRDLCADVPERTRIVLGDHDVLWNGAEDLRAAPLGECLFGAVKNRWGDFNLGLFVVVNCAETRELLAAVCDGGMSFASDPLFEHRSMNAELRRRKISCATLPKRWNHYRDAGPLSDGKPTVIRAWHNEDKHAAAVQMRCEVRKLLKACSTCSFSPGGCGGAGTSVSE